MEWYLFKYIITFTACILLLHTKSGFILLLWVFFSFLKKYLQLKACPLFRGQLQLVLSYTGFLNNISTISNICWVCYFFIGSNKLSNLYCHHPQTILGFNLEMGWLVDSSHAHRFFLPLIRYQLMSLIGNVWLLCFTAILIYSRIMEVIMLWRNMSHYS